MPEHDPLDDELRRMAERSADAAVEAVDVDTDLAAVERRIAGEGTSGSAGGARPDRRAIWLAAAAVAMVAAGAVALSARGGSDTIQTAADQNAATPQASVVTDATSLTTAPAPPTTLPVATSTTLGLVSSPATVPDCWRDPTPPPSLADGSPVGEPVSSDADKGTGIRTTTWGAGAVAVTHVLGMSIPPVDAQPHYLERIESGTWSAVVDFGAEPGQGYELVLYDMSVGCGAVYRFPLDEVRDAAVIAHAWVDHLGSGVPVPDGLHPELPAPVPYRAGVGASIPFRTHEFAPDGTDLGPVEVTELEDLSWAFPVDLGSGRRLGLADGPQYEPCPGARPTVIGGDGSTAVDQRLLDSPVSSIAGGASGFVVVSRGVCPEGSRWGEPGTAVELVRFHVDDPTVDPLVFARFEPQVDSNGYLRGRWQVSTIDPTGRYVGAVAPTSVETVSYHVLDVLAPDGSSGVPLDLPAGCDTDPVAPSLVAPPQFVVGGLVVLARGCGPDNDLVVDVVSLDDRSLLWSQTVEPGTSTNYGSGIPGFDAILVDGEVWALVTSGDETAGSVDYRLRTVLLNATDQVEITRLPFTTDYRFTRPVTN